MPQPRRGAPAAQDTPARGRTATRSSASEAPVARSSYRGAAGLRQMQEEQEKAEARKAAREASFGAPFRYFTPIGESRQIVVVDEAPDFFRHEHALQDRRSKRWDNYVPCIDEHANCPVCGVAERPAYFAMYLTIIDLSGYEGKDGWVEFSKKLLVVKPTQQKKIMRLYDRHKSLRGMVLQMTRDSKEDATIGNDIEFVEFMDEDELLTYETDYTDKEGKVHPIICHEPYDYDAIFPEMTEKQLRAIAGGKDPEAGSRESNNRALRGNDNEWEKDPKPAARTASRRSARDTEQDDEQDAASAPVARRSARGSAKEDDTPAPSRRRAAAPADDGEDDAAPAPRSARRGRAEPAPDPEDIDPETGAPWDDAAEGAEAAAPAEEAPSQRRTPRTATRGAAKEEADDAPQRPANSVAARRASLRR